MRGFIGEYRRRVRAGSGKEVACTKPCCTYSVCDGCCWFVVLASYFALSVCLCANACYYAVGICENSTSFASSTKACRNYEIRAFI